MAYFFGTYHHNLDSKGRLNLPAQLRKQISNESAGQLLITKGLKGGCLFVYPQDNWTKIMAELESQPRTEENRNALRIFAAESILAELDAQAQTERRAGTRVDGQARMRPRCAGWRNPPNRLPSIRSLRVQRGGGFGRAGRAVRNQTVGEPLESACA